MLEVYRNTTEHISHSVYLSGSPAEVDADFVEVSVYNPANGVMSAPVVADIMNLGRYQFRLPYAMTKYDGPLKSYWQYKIGGETVVAEEDIEVVTPYVSLDEITAAYPELDSKSYEELREMERRVRLIINEVTGQTFGARQYTTTVALQPDGTFNLGQKLWYVHYYTVGGYRGEIGDLNIINDGWVGRIVTFPTGYHDIKSDVWYSRRSNNTSVVLHGNFGWPSVPNDINVAAKMLIGDYFCSDAIYRQRGVQAVRAADWRLDFHDSAFTGTGNLDVDRLLGKYGAFNMVII